MEADFSYFSRRAHQEREAATKAAHPSAQRAHRDLADRYAELSSAIEAHQRTLRSVSAA